MIVTLEELREWMVVEHDHDDALIERTGKAAQRHCERILGFAIEEEFADGEIPDDLKQAVLQLAADWFRNREASLVGVSASAIPFGVMEILREYRRFTFG